MRGHNEHVSESPRRDARARLGAPRCAASVGIRHRWFPSGTHPPFHGVLRLRSDLRKTSLYHLSFKNSKVKCSHFLFPLKRKVLVGLHGACGYFSALGSTQEAPFCPPLTI